MRPSLFSVLSSSIARPCCSLRDFECKVAAEDEGMWHAETSSVRKCKHLRSLRQRLMATEEPLSVEGCRQFGKVPSTGSLCEFAWDAGEENVLRLLPRVDEHGGVYPYAINGIITPFMCNCFRAAV
jgi:hypothetical protein